MFAKSKSPYEPVGAGSSPEFNKSIGSKSPILNQASRVQFLYEAG